MAELRSGMTIGIGGWGSRRKPMSLVRAILRSDLTDLTVVSYGGPDVGLLVRRRQGPPARLRLRLAGLHPARAALPGRPPGRHDRGHRVRRGHAAVGAVRGGVPAAVPADPGRPRLRRAAGQPGPADRRVAVRRRGAASRCRRCRWTRRWCTSTAPTRPATPSTSAPTRTSTTCSARPPSRAYVSCERIVPTAELTADGTGADAAASSGAWCAAWSRRPAARTSPPASPTTAATRRSSASTPRAAGDPAAWAAFRARYLDVDEAGYQAPSTARLRVSA